jgi:hypothetical protein
MIDLERVEAWARHKQHDPGSCAEGDVMLLKLAAELRAAHRVLRSVSRPHCSQWCPCEQNQAWAAYDAATQDEAIP